MILPRPVGGTTADGASDEFPFRKFVLRSAIVLGVSAVAFPLAALLLITGLDVSPVDVVTAPFVWVFCGVVMAAQVMLLIGAPSWIPGRPRRRRALLPSAIAMGLSATAVVAGLGAVAFNVVELSRGTKLDGVLGDQVGAAVIAVAAAVWAVWAGVFAFMLWGNRVGAFGRVFRWLVGGTVLELAVTLPVDVAVRRRSSCYCGEGTAWALVLGLGSAGILFGPGMVLLALRRWSNWRRRDTHCVACGYDLTGLPEPRCPECGRPFQRQQLPVHRPSSEPSPASGEAPSFQNPRA